MGIWQGRLAEDVLRTDEAEFVAWRTGQRGAEGGESLDDLAERVHAAASEQLALGGVRLVVTHGGVVRAAMRVLLGIERTRLAAVGNCSLTIVEQGRDGPRLAAYNVSAAGAPRVQLGV